MANPHEEPPAVLIVEDEPLIRSVVVELLMGEGLQVVEAENAEKALDILSQRPDIGLLFTDIRMPGTMDGLALAKEVQRRWPQMLLILTSGSANVPPIPEEGVFIPKPYDFEALADKIHELLRSE
jgi:two-component system, response regulator PdtaR